MNRRRPAFAAALLVVIACGLASRRFGLSLPTFIATFAGDTLWATAAYLGFGLLAPRRASIVRVATAALAFAFIIEFAQLYHTPWLDSLRATTLGALFFGSGFLPSDLLCYTVGVGLGASIDLAIRSRGAQHRNR